MKIKKAWFWVVPVRFKGFKIVTRKPKGKNILEPFETRKQAERFIALAYLSGSFNAPNQ